MSLAIDVDRVCAVLLNDGWHPVENESFDIDAYEFVRNADGEFARPRLGGGQELLVPATGACWFEAGFYVYCPITSILAVKQKANKVT